MSPLPAVYRVVRTAGQELLGLPPLAYCCPRPMWAKPTAYFILLFCFPIPLYWAISTLKAGIMHVLFLAESQPLEYQ